ncbi:hypothetical protein Kpol_534p12 [Vanderwaltozyma polyspora DSM 70294]|uniref:DUF676 domain-containing protein n=1 Tax=Vanderwaltozyma polyspora (strain ATCC 22028 / DSM 70294 / BCRC 21397 / CBS 2163 / NBRC 10782 / NRRL Y-8283 / UCD 57-17) TaxID=436907 RepID=A7TJJ0_VANPO|nr:uncharacterized protein Kpol_534p12 [Vanderwaltozyma polyspora DSM 70294]EDO17533.1 hypothetical protein Kpol_534p12 [Vanderwaltozyma polyspora DSM 70294]
MTDDKKSDTLFFYKSAVKIGELERYVITYNLYEGDTIPDDLSLDLLWIQIKNIESLSYRAAYLVGPFTLYCDVKTGDYHHSQKIISSLDQPKFEANLQAQQTFQAELSLHTIKKQYVWIVDIMSQIVFTTNTQTAFEIKITRSRQSLFNNNSIDSEMGSHSPSLTVSRMNTLDIWNLPKSLCNAKKKKHLVILTHGLHSNVTADMEYTMEQIYKAQGKFPNEELIVQGYTGNVCQTEKGVKYLGSNLAKYIVKELYDESIVKISFIGHSLGGLVQTFALAFISVKYSWFFEKVEPVNFITIASPLLGLVTNNPTYVNMLLSMGVIGRTGQDISLEAYGKEAEPLLFKLPGDPVKDVLKKFKRRTIYANAINDGIVPLYSSSLLFLDYNDVLNNLKKLSDFKNLDIDSSDIESIFQSEELNQVDLTHTIKKSFVSPFTKILNSWTPHNYHSAGHSKIPKLSMFESATSVLMPPLPDKNYILDPNSREPIIVHDKIYTEADLPDPNSSNKDDLLHSDNILLKTLTIARGDNIRGQTLEESIARKWHEGLSWRKVIVALKPDAHNNIIVRRRFANAHGWLVVDHLIDTHFSGDDDITRNDTNPMDITTKDIKTANSLDNSTVEPNKKYAWITRVDNSSVFDEGPTGMISTVSEMFDVFTKRKIIITNENNSTTAATSTNTTTTTSTSTYTSTTNIEERRNSFEAFNSDFLL